MHIYTLKLLHLKFWQFVPPQLKEGERAPSAQVEALYNMEAERVSKNNGTPSLLIIGERGGGRKRGCRLEDESH